MKATTAKQERNIKKSLDNVRFMVSSLKGYD